METIGNILHDGDQAVGFLQEVAELIAIDNLPAPITVTLYKRSVLVREEHLEVWCKALGVEVPTWEQRPRQEGVEFADVQTSRFDLTSNRPIRTGTAVA